MQARRSCHRSGLGLLLLGLVLSTASCRTPANELPTDPLLNESLLWQLLDPVHSARRLAAARTRLGDLVVSEFERAERLLPPPRR